MKQIIVLVAALIIISVMVMCNCQQQPNTNIVVKLVKGVKNITKAVISGYAKSPVIANRQSICNTCQYNNNGQCSECLCVISIKTLFVNSSCPAKKW